MNLAKPCDFLIVSTIAQYFYFVKQLVFEIHCLLILENNSKHELSGNQSSNEFSNCINIKINKKEALYISDSVFSC